MKGARARVPLPELLRCAASRFVGLDDEDFSLVFQLDTRGKGPARCPFERPISLFIYGTSAIAFRGHDNFENVFLNSNFGV